MKKRKRLQHIYSPFLKLILHIMKTLRVKEKFQPRKNNILFLLFSRINIWTEGKPLKYTRNVILHVSDHFG